MYHCAVSRADAQNQSNMSMSMYGGHAGRLSVWWMWCYRSTKDLCCPIQQGIQGRISSLWRGLWCICASACLISANRKGLNGWPQLSADSSLYGASLAGQALCAAFWDLPPHPPGSSECHSRLIWGNTEVPPQPELIKMSLWEALGCFTVTKICFQ